LPAKIMLATLAMRAGDENRARTAFETLGERLKKDSLQATNTTIAAALVPALLDPRYAKIVIPILDKVAENYLTSGNVSGATDLRFKLQACGVLSAPER
jgi:hypothetical protein